MPRKNSVKFYLDNAFYHVYNRGVDKRNIFLEHEDYLYFLHLLKSLLSPEPDKGSTLVGKRTWPQKNFFGKIDLLCYCLMSNHFHLLLRQSTSTVVTEFMKSLCTRYGMYFNKKYKRAGSLFQGIFKAVDIDNENYLLWMSRYIHRNPADFENYRYSSYKDYIGEMHTSWVKSKIILDYFSTDPFKNRQNFVEFTGDNKNSSPIDLDYFSLESDYIDEPKQGLNP